MKLCKEDPLANVFKFTEGDFDIYCPSEGMADFSNLQGKLEILILADDYAKDGGPGAICPSCSFHHDPFAGPTFVFDTLWSSYSQVGFKQLPRACILNFKAVWIEIANLLTIVWFKCAKADGKSYTKVSPLLVRHLLCNRLFLGVIHAIPPPFCNLRDRHGHRSISLNYKGEAWLWWFHSVFNLHHIFPIHDELVTESVLQQFNKMTRASSK